MNIWRANFSYVFLDLSKIKAIFLKNKVIFNIFGESLRVMTSFAKVHFANLILETQEFSVTGTVTVLHSA